jgi:hypothetical protein
MLPEKKLMKKPKRPISHYQVSREVRGKNHFAVPNKSSIDSKFRPKIGRNFMILHKDDSCNKFYHPEEKATSPEHQASRNH